MAGLAVCAAMCVLLAWQDCKAGAHRTGMTAGGSRQASEWPGPLPGPWFLDLAYQAGLVEPDLGADSGRWSLPEQNGQGVALLDYDGDGRLDVFLPSGSSPEDMLAGRFVPDRLYRNLGNCRFEDVTGRAGLDHLGWSTGAAAADYDGDGWTDLYVTRVGPDVLYRNLGDGRFQDVSAEAGLAEHRYSSSAAWGDLDGDGDLDLWVTHHALFDPASFPRGASSRGPCEEYGIAVPCGPAHYLADGDSLFRNDGGRFTDVTVQAGLAAVEPGYGFGAVMVDVDLDGDLDLYVANDVGPNHLWVNDGRGAFREEATERGVATDGRGMPLGGMGVAVFDLDGDGLPDLGVTNTLHEDNTLYRNLGGGHFEDVSQAYGWSGACYERTGWGLGVFDLDLDGHLDALVLNGYLFGQLAAYKSFRELPVLLRGGLDGGFATVGAPVRGALAEPHAARGAAFGDLDGDGDLDVLVARLGAAPGLWINRAGDGRPALTVRLDGPPANRAGLGARVRVQAGGRSAWGYLAPQQSYASSHEAALHFALGPRAVAGEVEVHWPDGTVDRVQDLPAGVAVLSRGRGLTGWRPHGPGW